MRRFWRHLKCYFLVKNRIVHPHTFRRGKRVKSSHPPRKNPIGEASSRDDVLQTVASDSGRRHSRWQWRTNTIKVFSLRGENVSKEKKHDTSFIMTTAMSNQKNTTTQQSNLVDPDIDRSFASKINTCMCQIKRLNLESANGSLYQIPLLLMSFHSLNAKLTIINVNL
jgi:hypothetical protein